MSRPRFNFSVIIAFAAGARVGLMAVCLGALAAGAPAYAQEKNNGYVVRWITTAPDDLVDRLKENSDLVNLKSRKVETMWELSARIRRDLSLFNKILRAEGYYAAQVSYDINELTRPIDVRLRIDEGPSFQIQDFDVTFTGNADIPDGLAARVTEIRDSVIGRRARSAMIMEAYGEIQRNLPKFGFPHAEADTVPAVVIDHAARAALVTIEIDQGRAAVFGATEISGLTSVEADHVRSYITWREGERYDERKIDSSHRALFETGLFQTLEVDDSAPVSEDGTLPIHIKVSESEHRSIGAGVSYSTVENFGGDIFWEHRNFLGDGETLRLEVAANELIQTFNTQFIRPQFMRLDQRLFLDFEAQREDTEAFNEKTVGVGAAIERVIGNYWTVRAGFDVDFSDITEFSNAGEIKTDRQLGLLGFPVSANLDTTKDPLDPRSGLRIFLQTTPYLTIEDTPLIFVRNEIGARYYHAIDDAGRYVAAARVRVGSIVGQERVSIPANKRFYAGGGASIRGYNFQLVGPLDADNDPIGGRSVIELAGEFRARITENIGLVPFIEGGAVYTNTVPDFSETWRWAAGLGGRYHTAIGPIRIDLAFPINGRPVDDTLEFYISLGQSF